MEVRLILEAKSDFGSLKKGEKLLMYNEIFNPQNGIAFFPIDTNQWKLIAYDQWTGRFDSKNNKLYNNDVIEFDENEWCGGNNIHTISWNDYDSAWCWGGGLSTDMEWRTKIGNKYNIKEFLK